MTERDPMTVLHERRLRAGTLKALATELGHHYTVLADTARGDRPFSDALLAKLGLRWAVVDDGAETAPVGFRAKSITRQAHTTIQSAIDLIACLSPEDAARVVQEIDRWAGLLLEARRRAVAQMRAGTADTIHEGTAS